MGFVFYGAIDRDWSLLHITTHSIGFSYIKPLKGILQDSRCLWSSQDQVSRPQAHCCIFDVEQWDPCPGCISKIRTLKGFDYYGCVCALDNNQTGESSIFNGEFDLMKTAGSTLFAHKISGINQNLLKMQTIAREFKYKNSLGGTRTFTPLTRRYSLWRQFVFQYDI